MRFSISLAGVECLSRVVLHERVATLPDDRLAALDDGLRLVLEL